MKKLILQHWTGPMNELTELSSRDISRYAERVGASYKLLRGQVFRKHLSAPCQKVHMLDESFDKFNMVFLKSHIKTKYYGATKFWNWSAT